MTFSVTNPQRAGLCLIWMLLALEPCATICGKEAWLDTVSSIIMAGRRPID